MNLLNLYFTPFATALVLAAIYFSEPEKPDRDLAFVFLLLSLVVNHLITKYTYRIVGWAGRMKLIQVWLTFLWSIPLFYLLGAYWAPMWLLFTMAPATAALYQGRWQTLATAAVSGGTMLGVYALRARSLGLELGEQHWAMAGAHAAFIVVMAMFVNAMAESALRLRDIGKRV
ncbi:MAG TPA: hypothetical protein DCM05_12145 [Elusimicrobia bacterium]|nr:hypothetical protein [Elusimicrobiota bacterium]